MGGGGGMIKFQIDACITFKMQILMHQSIETPTLWVPGKGGGFDIDPSQKASISLPPEAIV